MATSNWRTVIIISATIGAAAGLPAQQGSVSGPMAGLVFDSAAHALRPILGIPGASTIGDPLSLAFDVASAWVSPGQDSAFLVSSDGALHIVRISSGTVVERAIDGVSAAPERVWYSPSGSAAALYSAGKAQIVTGLPDSAAVANTADLIISSVDGGAPSAFAISDDGSYVLFAAGGSVRLRGAGSGSGSVDQNLMSVGDGALVAFAPGSSTVAAVSDPGGAGLAFFANLSGASGASILAAPDDGTASPVGLAFSPDGRRLFLASAGARSVAAFDLGTGDRVAVGCGCTPAGLSSMGNLFRLTELSADPLWLLDAGTAGPRIVFVPAMAAAGAAN